MKLTKSLARWGTDEFEATFKQEVYTLERTQLPLQQGLTQSSYVSDSKVDLVILNIAETSTELIVKTGVFYSGIIAGSCCADDPTPVCEQTEYCELIFNIDKTSAETKVRLHV